MFSKAASTPALSTAYSEGKLFRIEECAGQTIQGCHVREIIAPGFGSKTIAATRVDLAANCSWSPNNGAVSETVGVVFTGGGELKINAVSYLLQESSTFYAPTGLLPQLTAGATAGMAVYLWRALLPNDRKPSWNPQLVSNLWDNKTSCRLLAGEGDPLDAGMIDLGESDSESLDPATMHFLHWPGTGTPMLCLHCGIQMPGQMFPIHRHRHSEELFIAFRGDGECFLNGVWQPMSAGDVLFAPPGLLHGARNAKRQGEPFITCGGPTPFDPLLYRLAGVSPDVQSSCD